MTEAIAVFTEGPIRGYVRFLEEGRQVAVELRLAGLRANSEHGFHVHEAGDLTDKCMSML